MTDWATLQACYGSAEEIPELLEALEPDPGSPVWEALWSQVCHQGTTYEASPYVLPYLADVGAGWKPTERVMPLVLAGAIVAAPETRLDGFENAAADLRRLALETVTARELDRRDRLYAMQALLALEGDRLWSNRLEGLNDGEFEVTCLHCGAGTLIRIPGDSERCAVEELPPLGARLRSFAINGGDEGLAELICELFGRKRCSECGRLMEN